MVRAQVGAAAWNDAPGTAATATSAFEAVAFTMTGVAKAEMRVMATSVAVRVMTGSPGRAQCRLHGGDHRGDRAAPLCGRTHKADRPATCFMTAPSGALLF